MLELIEDLLNYIENPNNSNMLKNAEEMIGGHLLRVASINIADWLRLENKRDIWLKEGKQNKSKPLLLNYSYPWCQSLKRLIEEDELFAKTFSINGNEFYYSFYMKDKEREKARQLAAKTYNPPLMR